VRQTRGECHGNKAGGAHWPADGSTTASRSARFCIDSDALEDNGDGNEKRRRGRARGGTARRRGGDKMETSCSDSSGLLSLRGHRL